MPETPARSPATTLGEDRGDETARRFRFQWTYAAIACCQLLDETQDVVEVFCEHHEDVLLRHDDHRFSGVQIKSRDSSQDPWKTSDEGVRKSLARFVQLEEKFPGQFREFRFLTNHPLFRRKNGRDLAHVLAEVHAAGAPSDLPSPIQAVLRRAARDVGCSEEAAFAALRKTSADDSLPKLPDALMRLINTLTQVWGQATSAPYVEVLQASRALVSACAEASSLAHAELLAAYLPRNEAAPTDAQTAERISGKRFDKVRVLAVLASEVEDVGRLFGDLSELDLPSDGPRTLLRTKLDTGGFSAVSLNSAADLRDKAEFLAVTWQKQIGSTSGLQRYNHVRSLVLSDSASAFEQCKAAGDPFGPAMLDELRRRLRERARTSAVYRCSAEHLEGFAYGLTAQCQVHWSESRPWENA